MGRKLFSQYDKDQILHDLLLKGDSGNYEFYIRRGNAVVDVSDVRGLPPEKWNDKSLHNQMEVYKSNLSALQAIPFLNLHPDSLIEAYDCGEEIGEKTFAGTKIPRVLRLKTDFDDGLVKGVFYSAQARDLIFDDLWVVDELNRAKSNHANRKKYIDEERYEAAVIYQRDNPDLFNTPLNRADIWNQLNKHDHLLFPTGRTFKSFFDYHNRQETKIFKIKEKGQK
jgi:hypothetical protein